MAAIKTLRRRLLRRLGYRRIESPNKGLDPYETVGRLLAGRDARHLFDIGANVGQTARKLRRVFPGSRIWSFEPFPDAHAALRASLEGDELSEARSEAVAEAVGTRTFHVNRFNYNHSLLDADRRGADWARIDHVDAIEVPVTTVDDFCREHAIESLGLLKTDAEGGDLMVLRGAAEMLAAGRVDCVYTEALFVPIFESQAWFHQVCELLHGHGYRLFDLFEHRYAKDGRLTVANGLFVSPAFEDVRHTSGTTTS